MQIKEVFGNGCKGIFIAVTDCYFSEGFIPFGMFHCRLVHSVNENESHHCWKEILDPLTRSSC